MASVILSTAEQVKALFVNQNILQMQKEASVFLRNTNGQGALSFPFLLGFFLCISCPLSLKIVPQEIALSSPPQSSGSENGGGVDGMQRIKSEVQAAELLLHKFPLFG